MFNNIMEKITHKKELDNLKEDYAGLLEALTKANSSNRELNNSLLKMKQDLEDQKSVIRRLSEENKNYRLREQAKNHFNDDERNY